ncbi:MAG: hypothetical protein IV090_21880 [Candidatus Sericytochromatia bacterium]|nr:hypothetical protein [Candidatus Sericytochromatia bacterium]
MAGSIQWVRLRVSNLAGEALSGNNQMSCATCHDPRKGFSNGEANAAGIDGIRGPRNVPALYTLAYQPAFFHDGRTATLDAQALEPIQNPIEMHESLPQAIADLQAIPIIHKNFRPSLAPGFRPKASPRLWPALSGPWSCTIPLMTSAVMSVAFFQQRCCVAPCRDQCGSGPARSGPYMHDGSLATLNDVLDYYIRGGNADPNLDPNKAPLNLSAEQKADLLAFLESLTGQSNLKQLLDLPGTRLPGETLDLPPLD